MNVALNLRAWPDVSDIFNVGFDGCCIGRIWLAHDRTDTDMPWEWIISIPMALPDSSKGKSNSFQAAARALAMAWGQILSATAPARLQSALALLRATGVVMPARNDATPFELLAQAPPKAQPAAKSDVASPAATRREAAVPKPATARLAQMSPTDVRVQYSGRPNATSAAVAPVKPVEATTLKAAASPVAGSNGGARPPAPDVPVTRPTNASTDAALRNRAAGAPPNPKPSRIEATDWSNLA